LPDFFHQQIPPGYFRMVFLLANAWLRWLATTTFEFEVRMLQGKHALHGANGFFPERAGGRCFEKCQVWQIIPSAQMSTHPTTVIEK